MIFTGLKPKYALRDRFRRKDKPEQEFEVISVEHDKSDRSTTYFFSGPIPLTGSEEDVDELMTKIK